MRHDYIGIILISLSKPETFEQIENIMKKQFPEEKFRYTKRYQTNFIELVKKFGYDISKENINRTIESAFEYDVILYMKEYAERLKVLYEELGNATAVRNYLKKLNGKMIPQSQRINQYTNRLLQEPEYLSGYGKNGYKQWREKYYRVTKKSKSYTKYSIKFAELLKALFEKHGNATAVRDFLENQKVEPLPNAKTVTSFNKKLFNEPE